ncbi:1-acyl-sn-glycerol-3-phosphate acyltransferase [Endozoicomonas sp. SCSIO W0465]|uniref:1-acyl-sn-glycerol-3-phosphate acyltransferase n=1 Tax=Endozoicomonas sp. SCSIO W0465 TaxID=2918516 RepID=UPI002074AD04|nr:1-acyl-sn-glycerol-3-phosphate acyltransferase [Endozoicomonas sp. SCSIO W0465]USE34543.1 1-acyl-sn-glycerol-3-phosphate acyltransferase [Endozoicomonas sp. SCSIO W0465]
MEAFDDIRPYHDHEVRPTLERLLNDNDLLNVMAKHRYPGLTRQFSGVMTWMMALALKYKTRNIHNVRDFQAIIEPYLTRVIKTTTSKVSFSGLDLLKNEHQKKDKAYLFLSNHRDIVLDPALVNYALYLNDMETCQIAIGDNLVKRPFVSDLMRLNKSFIVKRSLSGRREKLLAFQNLSAYIHHCIDSGQPVWIAQSEGRAKDGNDQTDPAIIKMFNLSRRNKQSIFADNIRSLNIVPVSISYEFDPCDCDKARELYEKQQTGQYQKADDEDLKSIVTGIQGYKGHVHVAFGKPLTQDFEDAASVVKEVNHQIHHNYELQPSNLFAWEAISSEINQYEPVIQIPELSQLFPNIDLQQKRNEFTRHLQRCPELYRTQFLKMYAQPVINRFRYGS